MWTGSAHREFEVWRDRYPGRLTLTEEAFGAAMTAHAQRSARRRRGLLNTWRGPTARILSLDGASAWRSAFGPDGRWVASSTKSDIRLWPVPDLGRPPFHNLPRA